MILRKSWRWKNAFIVLTIKITYKWTHAVRIHGIQGSVILLFPSISCIPRSLSRVPGLWDLFNYMFHQHWRLCHLSKFCWKSWVQLISFFFISMISGKLGKTWRSSETGSITCLFFREKQFLWALKWERNF